MEELFEAGGQAYIVDDDASFRRAVSRVLSAAGLAVRDYETVYEFLDAGLADAVSCILVDMFMPEATAFDLLSRLAAADYTPPVILITACTEVSNTVDTMKAGAVDYLVKPVSRKELFRAVRRALELDASRRPKRAMARTLRQHYATLSGVEKDVFVGISSGRINKQLSIDLSVCERTIKSLRAAVMAKMHADSLPSLVRGASVLGLGRALPTRDRHR